MTSQQGQVRRRWSQAERERLAELARAATPVTEIAAELGRSTSAVHQQLATLRARDPQVPRLAAPPWTKSEDAELIQAVGEGETAASVARRLGRTPRAAQARHRHLTGAAAPLPRWTAAEDALLIAGYRRGAAYSQLAEQLGRSLSAIAARAKVLRGREEAELDERRPRWSDARRRHLARRRAEGASLRELEREFDIRRGTLTAQLRTLRRLGYLNETTNTYPVRVGSRRHGADR